MYEVFIADCKREMSLRKMNNEALAKLTDYKLSTINAFFSEIKARDRSENVAIAISKALNIEL